MRVFDVISLEIKSDDFVCFLIFCRQLEVAIYCCFHIHSGYPERSNQMKFATFKDVCHKPAVGVSNCLMRHLSSYSRVAMAQDSTSEARLGKRYL